MQFLITENLTLEFGVFHGFALGSTDDDVRPNDVASDVGVRSLRRA